jgi:cell wall-associated NlpC family hydrolase
MTNTELIGIPFERGGRGPDSFDCYGLCRYIIERDQGVKVPDYGAPEDAGMIHALMVGSREFWRRLDYPKEGALVMFKTGRFIAHCGIVIPDYRFIHTWEQSGGVVTERLDHWKHRIVGFYEYSDSHATQSP